MKSELIKYYGFIIRGIQRLKWKYDFFGTKQEKFFKEIEKTFFLIIKGDHINTVLAIFGKLDKNYKELPPILDTSEFLIAGNDRNNNLIIKFLSARPAPFIYKSLYEKAKMIKSNFPRLRFLVIIKARGADFKPLKTISEYGGYYLYLEDYDTSFSIVEQLHKFALDPKKCSTITSSGIGKNI